MLRALDAAYLEAASADHPEKNEPATKVSARPFSLEVFDALFGG
jgi:hypothetical protein